MFGKSKEIGTSDNPEHSAGDGWADLMNGPDNASVSQESEQNKQSAPTELQPKEPLEETASFNPEMFEESEVNPDNMTNEPPEMQQHPDEHVDPSGVISNAEPMNADIAATMERNRHINYRRPYAELTKEQKDEIEREREAAAQQFRDNVPPEDFDF